jgi:hypothetical protein
MYYYGKGVATDYRKSFDLFDTFVDMRGSDTRIWPYVYNIENLNGNVSQEDLVYYLVSDDEVTGEAYYYRGLQYKYGQGVPDD